MEGNILSGGLKELNAVKDKITELNNYRDNCDELTSEEARLEKNIKNKEKDILEEISSTHRKRKEEIEYAYNEQMDKVRNRIKKIRNKKERSKTEKVSERIEAETAGLKEEYRQMAMDIKEQFKLHKIPLLCNSRLFYAIFLPKGLLDALIIMLTLVVILLALPYIIYSLWLPEGKMIYLFLIYLLLVVVFGGLYMLLDSNIKSKHIKVLGNVGQLRIQMMLNRKKRNEIRKGIIKDKDESIYGLEDFDQELAELDRELSEVMEQKKEALRIFENTTKHVIKEEITFRYQEELNVLKQDYAKIYADIKALEENIKNLSMDITNTYEVYLGKEFMSVDKLEKLIQIIEENQLSTVSEAISFYRGES
jgi:DNA repair exonuclease SbcCD ATPase subunit